ncbi:hypothetical protein MycrhN_2347 [Mycolicibacterium rhodesiae NBB3]|jgi:hypothetical protein|uniref:Intersectin-EH binding protein Ibp1 n=1 Tax=Mycolicibacterium rhodesiae (strain NBB3) TaxID=710685 RepID=G8RU94_MYCRN|nr:hypothetical protein [Mycolicibacterium rhodesiae]AEV72937.1 hypothetical protein MycrhN_2347 [Mycolicibacterium rhodesiae NBB3]
MATFQLSARRLILAGGFAVAVAAAPAVALFAVPVTPTASVAQGCAGGEEPDTFTGNCIPHTVPNSGPSPFSTSAGNPDMPVVGVPGGGGSIPCTGANSGQCIGLAEEQQSEGPMAVPNSTVGHSPTVTN